MFGCGVMTRADLLLEAASAERSAAYWQALGVGAAAEHYRLEAMRLRALVGVTK